MGGYRNCGKLVYYGGIFHILGEDADIDEYGYLPSIITINQFGNAKYFTKSITHNYYVWHDHVTYPKISEAVLPQNIMVNNDYYDHPRLVNFRNGWTLITNMPNSTDQPYSSENNDAELNLSVLPRRINLNKLMFNIIERKVESNPNHNCIYRD